MKFKSILVGAAMLLPAITANAQKLKQIMPDMPNHALSAYGLSPDGDYVIGLDLSWTTMGAYFQYAFIADLHSFDGSSTTYYKAAGHQVGYLTDVNNLGIACGNGLYSPDGEDFGIGYCIPSTENLTDNKILASNGATSAINEKNSVVATVDVDGISKPVIFTADGTKTILPTPEFLLNDKVTQYMVTPLWVSNDNEIIIGDAKDVITNKCVPVKWQKDGDTYVCSPIATDYVDHVFDGKFEYKSFEISDVSENGAWICGVFQSLETNKNSMYVVRYNVLSNTFETLESISGLNLDHESQISSEIPIVGRRQYLITNDGVTIGLLRNNNFYWSQGETDATVFNDAYPVLYDLDGYNSESYISLADISEDGKRIVGNWNGGIVIISEADNAATGISDKLNTENPSNDNIYTISGTRVNSISAPGLYIKNGKKIIVR